MESIIGLLAFFAIINFLMLIDLNITVKRMDKKSKDKQNERD